MHNRKLSVLSGSAKAGFSDRVVMECNMPFLMDRLIFGYVLIIGMAIWFV